MGIIKQVNELDLVVSLPNQLTGSVAITEISETMSTLIEQAVGNDDESENEDDESELPELNELFAVGQVVVCRIVALTQSASQEDMKKKRIELSLRPDLVNAGLSKADVVKGMILPAAICSSEDHGYVVSLGIEGLSGFLPSNKIDSDASDSELPVGSVVAVSVKSVDNGRIATVSMNSQDLQSASISSKEGLELNQVRPGSLVSAKVSAISDSGLSVSVYNFFTASIDYLHLDKSCLSSSDLESQYSVGKKLKARVVYIDSGSKTIGLSLLPHLLQMRHPGFGSIELGEIFQTLSVLRVDPVVGLLVAIDENHCGYVHVSRIADERVTKIDKKYRVGSVHPGRVIGLDYCDNLVMLSLQPSVLSESFFKVSDVNAGSIVKAKVRKLLPTGVFVAITDSISAFCPKSHMSDVTLKVPEKMFSEGALLKFQVLSVDAASKRIIVTHRKSLMTSKLEIITSYKDAKVGQITMGVISAVKQFGCIVGFYNDTRALVPIAELSESFIENPAESFKVGQSAKCRILSVDPNEEKMRASFKMTLSNASSKAPISVGEFVSGTVATKTEDALIIDLENGSSVKLEKSHLSDFPSNAEKMWKALVQGSMMKDILVYAIDKRNAPKVTLKRSFVTYTRNSGCISSVDAVEIGSIVPAVVQNVTEKLCFVDFVGGLTAMATFHNVSDAFVSNVNDHLKPGISVLAYVTNVDKEEGKISISLKQSQLSSCVNYKRLESERLSAFLDERESFVTTPSDIGTTFTLGQVVQGTVDKKLPTGYLVKLESNASGFLNNPKKEFELGDTESMRVLDFDAETNIFDLSVYKTAQSNKSLSKQQSKAMKAFKKDGKSLEGVVELIKEHYAVLSFPKCHDALGYCLVRHPNVVGGHFTRFKTGDQVVCDAVQVPETKSESATFLQQRMLVVPRKVDTPARTLEAKRMLKDSIDERIKSMDDIKIGLLTKAVVKGVKKTQLNMKLSENLFGRIHVTEVYDFFADVKNVEKPFDQFKKGNMLDVKVIGFHDAKTHKFLPFSHRNPISQTVVDFTIRPSNMSLPEFQISEERLTLESIDVGSKHFGFVQSVDEEFVWVSLGTNLSGRVHALCASSDPGVCSDLAKYFQQGKCVECHVISKSDSKKQHLNLSLLGKEPVSTSNLSVGEIVCARVAKIHPSKGISLQLSDKLTARVHLCDIHDTAVDNPVESFEVGKYVRTIILNIDPETSHIDCSIAPSVVAQSGDPKVKSVKDLKEGDVVHGYIRDISEKGCFVDLGHNMVARIKICDLSDAFVANWKSEFNPGDLVKGKVMSIDETKNQIQMSLKISDVDPEAGSTIRFDDLKQGDKVVGHVKRVDEFGVFITIKGTSITGLCHKSEVSDSPVPDIKRLFSEGDRVKAIVLRVKKESKKVSFGLKPSYFDAEDADEESSESEGEDGEGMDVDEGVAEKVVESDDGSESDGEEDGEASECSDASEIEEDTDASEFEEDTDEDSMEVDGPVQPKDKPTVSNVAPLAIDGFSWDGSKSTSGVVNADDSESSSSDDDDAAESDADKPTKKKSRRAKKREKAEEEARIAKKELDLVQSDRPPEVADDFERLLIGSPSNSYLWIKYIVFHLQMAEVEKARQVAERALKTIAFRDEQERLNLWVAYLNLENSYGTPESLAKVFERASQMNDSKTAHLHLARIYDRTGKEEECTKFYQKMCKSFKDDKKIWIEYATYLMTHKKEEDARALLSRSLKSIPKSSHIDTTKAFALLEFKHGEAERGRTIFEGILSSFPKRIDLWSVYLDMETKTGDLETTRRLFERVLILKMSTKQMKFMFKKYLEFEKQHGDIKSVEHVKEAAMRYVQSIKT